MKKFFISLLIEGKDSIVFDKSGREITRREGFSSPSRFVINFPAEGNEGFAVSGGKIVTTKIHEIPRIDLVLPAKEKALFRPAKIVKETYIANWHSPASINVKTGRMIFNKEYADASKAKQLFIKSHEFGHFFYDTEKYCDLYASLCLLKNGYGKSQCLEVLRKMLNPSPQKVERYNYVLNALKK